METHIDYAPACVRFYKRRCVVTAHFRQESRYPDRKGLIYLQGFDIISQAAPSQM